jgi:hypothetical protein
MAAPPWLPEESIYLDRADDPVVRMARPYNQGDVFLDVGIGTVGSRAESAKLVKGPVLLLGHPCAIHAGGRIIDTQFVVSVRRMADAIGERTFEPPWDSHLYLFPLPQLLGAEDYVADFRRVGTTHFKNLEHRRIACLSHAGWAALQRRWAWHTLRADLALASRIDDLQGLWNELNLWERSNELGKAYADFPAWVDGAMASGTYVGTRRRDLLDFAVDELQDELVGGSE